MGDYEEMNKQINAAEAESELREMNVFISRADDVRGVSPAPSYLQGNLIKLSAPALSGLDHAEQHIGVHGALVSFVQDHHSVAQQQGVSDGLAQEHAVGHELQLCLRGGDILETHRVTNLKRSVLVYYKEPSKTSSTDTTISSQMSITCPHQ